MSSSIWNRLKPAISSPSLSAEVRQNFQALDQLSLVNCLGDPYFLIWPSGDTVTQGNRFGHWHIDGGAGAHVDRETGAGNFLRGGMSCKITYGTSVTRLWQALLDTSVFVAAQWQGLYVSASAKVKTSNLNAARLYLYDGHQYDSYSSYHTGGGSFELLTSTMQLDSNSTQLVFGVENAASGDVYVDECCFVLGPVPPQTCLPAAVVEGTLLWKHTGTPTAGTDKNRFYFSRPTLIRDVFLAAATAPSGGPFTVDLNTYIAGWQSMYGATKPQITSGSYTGSRVPDGNYNYRCFDGGYLNAIINEDIDTVNGAATIYVHVRTLQYMRPLQDLAAYDDMG